VYRRLEQVVELLGYAEQLVGARGDRVTEKRRLRQRLAAEDRFFVAAVVLVVASADACRFAASAAVGAPGCAATCTTAAAGW
jgi:hypothetical protein